eukprot:CFRG6742T1
MSGVGTLEEQALKRKARLAAMRAQVKGTKDADPIEQTKKRTHGDVDTSVEDEDDEKIDSIKLRNYDPVGDVPILDGAAIDETKEQAKLQLAEEEKQLIDINEEVLATVDVTKLAPQKITWDLQRDLSKRMAKLDRRTEKAIVELVAQRLKEAAHVKDKSIDGKGVVGLDMAVNAGALVEQIDGKGSDSEGNE